jgi:gluconolactonase
MSALLTLSLMAHPLARVPGAESPVIAPDATVDKLAGGFIFTEGPAADAMGNVYFTDPYYKRPYWKRGPMAQDGQCVYYLSPDHQTLTRVADDLKQPNGIIGTPGGNTLYVADIRAQKTYAYRFNSDGTLTDKRLFCPLGSDGMTMDNEGNVYLTGRGVTVFDRHGARIEQINIPEPWTANVCFGGKDNKTLFVTASKGLYGVRMRVRGVGSQ